MWCPEGYIALSEIDIQFMWDMDAVPPANDRGDAKHSDGSSVDPGLMSDQEIDAFTAWRWAAFFALLGPKVKACLPSGNLVRVARSVTLVRGPVPQLFPETYLERIKCNKIGFYFVNSSVFTISGGSESRGEHYPALRAIKGAALCIAEADLPVGVHELTSWILRERKREAERFEAGRAALELEQTLAETLVNAFKSGRVSTKPEAKRLFAPNMKFVEWDAIWKEAVARMPELKKPGPKAR